MAGLCRPGDGDDMADARERTGPLRSGHRLQPVVSMSYIRALRGISSGIEYDADVPMNLDPADGRPVEMVLDIERLAVEKPAAAWYDPGRRDLWRFGALMALDIADPEDARHIVALGEGHTPLLDYRDHPFAQAAGLALQVKEEGKAHSGYGANPTQSFKDRGMAMVSAQARRLGLTKLAVPTQGNAGDSLTRYALAAGLSVVVAMPDDTPMPILGNVAAAARRYPDRVKLELVGPTIREAGAYLKEHYIPQGYFSVATFQEPGWRIEGKKSLDLELAEPASGDTRWSLPDAVIYPTGGGTGVLGMWKAWSELEALGLSTAVARACFACRARSHRQSSMRSMRAPTTLRSWWPAIRSVLASMCRAAWATSKSCRSSARAPGRRSP